MDVNNALPTFTPISLSKQASKDTYCVHNAHCIFSQNFLVYYEPSLKQNETHTRKLSNAQ